MTDVTLNLLKSAGVNIAVLGNTKAAKWFDKQPEEFKADKNAKQRKEYIAQCEKPAARKAEALKMKEAVEKGTLTLDAICKAVESIGGTLGIQQLQGYLGMKKPAKRKSGYAAEQVTAVFTAPVVDNGSITITKEQNYFFEAILSMMKQQDVEHAKKIVKQRIVAEQVEALNAKADAALEALDLSQWSDVVKAGGGIYRG